MSGLFGTLSNLLFGRAQSYFLLAYGSSMAILIIMIMAGVDGSAHPYIGVFALLMTGVMLFISYKKLIVGGVSARGGCGCTGGMPNPLQVIAAVKQVPAFLDTVDQLCSAAAGTTAEGKCVQIMPQVTAMRTTIKALGLS